MTRAKTERYKERESVNHFIIPIVNEYIFVFWDVTGEETSKIRYYYFSKNFFRRFMNSLSGNSIQSFFLPFFPSYVCGPCPFLHLPLLSYHLLVLSLSRGSFQPNLSSQNDPQWLRPNPLKSKQQNKKALFSHPISFSLLQLQNVSRPKYMIVQG